VVMCGVATASLITLFAIPVAYNLLARNTAAPGTVAKRLDRELNSVDR
jgi:multidrug efflux pump